MGKNPLAFFNEKVASVRFALVNEPYRVTSNLIAFNLLVFSFVAVILSSGSDSSASILLQVSEDLLAVVMLLIVFYLLWWSERIGSSQVRSLQKRFQLLQFKLSAPSWSVGAMIALTLYGLAFYVPVTQRFVGHLFVPLLLSIYPVLLSSLLAVAVADTKTRPDITAIDAIASFGRVANRTNIPSYERLWRNVWSYLLGSVESAFRMNNLLHMEVDFSRPLNAVALALTIGTDDEVAQAVEWLRTLRSTLGEEGPLRLIMHMETVPSKFSRWFELQNKYSLNYVRSSGRKRFLRSMSLGERVLLLLFGALAAAWPVYQAFK